MIGGALLALVLLGTAQEPASFSGVELPDPSTYDYPRQAAFLGYRMCLQGTIARLPVRGSPGSEVAAEALAHCKPLRPAFVNWIRERAADDAEAKAAGAYENPEIFAAKFEEKWVQRVAKRIDELPTRSAAPAIDTSEK